MENRKHFKQTDRMYWDAVGASQIGLDTSLSSGAYPSMERNSYDNSNDKTSNFRRYFQTNQDEQIHNYSSAYSQGSNTKDLMNNYRRSSDEANRIVEYPVDIYPKSSLEDIRISYPKQTIESQSRHDSRSNLMDYDSRSSYQSYSQRSPISNLRNDNRRSLIGSNSDHIPKKLSRKHSPEPEMRGYQRNTHRSSPELRLDYGKMDDYRTSRNERPFDRNTRRDSRERTWLKPPERYEHNSDSYSRTENIPSLLDSISLRESDIYTRENSHGVSNSSSKLTEAESNSRYSKFIPSGFTEAERSLRYSSTSSGLTEAERRSRYTSSTPSGLTEAERSLRFSPNTASAITEAERSLRYSSKPSFSSKPSSSSTEAERSLRYISKPSSGVTEAERRLRFNPPVASKSRIYPSAISNRQRNGRGQSHIFRERAPISLQNSRKEMPKPKPKWPSLSSKMTKSVIRQNREKKGGLNLQIGRKIAKTPIKEAAKALRALMDLESPKMTVNTSLPTTQIKQSIAPGIAPSKQPDALPSTVSTVVPAKKKKKKKKKKKPQVLEIENTQQQGKTKQPEKIQHLEAIVPRNFPLQKILFNQIALLKQVLLQEIIKIDDANLRPKLVTSYRRRGMMIPLYCENDTTLEWLKNIVKTLKPWEGANFRVLQQRPQSFSWSVIVSNGFPDKYMTRKDLYAIQEAISNKMDEELDDNIPIFHDSYHRRGALMVAYKTESDLEWLRNAVQTIEPWEGAQLRVLDLAEIPAYSKIEMWVPSPPEDLDKVLKRLDVQNDGLKTNTWFVIQQKEKDAGHTMVASVEEKIIEALQKIDYKPFLNFNRITVVNSGPIKRVPFTPDEFEQDLGKVKLLEINEQTLEILSKADSKIDEVINTVN